MLAAVRKMARCQRQLEVHGFDKILVVPPSRFLRWFVRCVRDGWRSLCGARGSGRAIGGDRGRHSVRSCSGPPGFGVGGRTAPCTARAGHWHVSRRDAVLWRPCHPYLHGGAAVRQCRSRGRHDFDLVLARVHSSCLSSSKKRERSVLKGRLLLGFRETALQPWPGVRLGDPLEWRAAGVPPWHRSSRRSDVRLRSRVS